MNITTVSFTVTSRDRIDNKELQKLFSKHFKWQETCQIQNVLNEGPTFKYSVSINLTGINTCIHQQGLFIFYPYLDRYKTN